MSLNLAKEDLLSKLLNCLSLEQTDPSKYLNIIQENFNITQSSQLLRSFPLEHFSQYGLSVHEICEYLSNMLEGLVVSKLEKLLLQLEQKGIIDRGDTWMTFFSEPYSPMAVRYKLSKYGLKLLKLNLVENSIYGFPFIIDRYKNNIVKVLGKTLDGDDTLGTGFMATIHLQLYIITCKHTVDKINGLHFTVNDQVIEYSKIYNHPNPDIDCVVVECSGLGIDFEGFELESESNTLDEIITMGYPAIPCTGDAYLMTHKGEINGIAMDYEKQNEIIIFSAKTSSGNSGSPVINNVGAVIGLVSNELFDKDKFMTQGKPPYYAAIPINVLTDFLSWRS